MDSRMMGCTALALLACNVESSNAPTGGIDLPEGGMERASDPDAAIATARGLAVFNSDRESTSVSLVGLDGSVLSETFIATSSTSAGLSAPLSGDVVPSSQKAPGGELVLIDRFPASVLTWVDLESAEVRAQLSVGTGFSANPHDYVEVSPTQAYVPRFDPNADRGAEPFDGGADVLVIDPSVPEIVGRIDLAPTVEGEGDGIHARGDRALLAGGLVRVGVIALDVDFERSADSRVVTIDPETDRITDVLVLDGLSSCAVLALSPTGDRIAAACNGDFGQDPADGFPDSGVAILSVGSTLEEVDRVTAEAIGGQVSWVEWESDSTLLVTTFGRWNDDRSAPAIDDAVRRVDLDGPSVSAPIIESADAPFSLQETRCVPERHRCFVTDAGRDGGALHVLVAGQSDTDLSSVDRATGLPPRHIGLF